MRDREREREVIEAIKGGRPFMLTASGPTSAQQDLLGDLQRYTNIAMAELRGDVARLESDHSKLRSALEAVASPSGKSVEQAERIARRALDLPDSHAPREKDGG